MSDEDVVFRRLKRSTWLETWNDFILSGDDNSNHHVLHRHGWTFDEFIDFGLKNGHIEKEQNE